MNYPSYYFSERDDALQFDFESISDWKVVKKRIIYSNTGTSGLYNLALVDVETDGRLSDKTRTNNDDLAKVIATTYQTLLTFFQNHPNNLVIFRGSDEEGVRNRLYRVVISRELDELNSLFDVYGVYENAMVEPFERNKSYIAFIIRLKPKL